MERNLAMESVKACRKMNTSLCKLLYIQNHVSYVTPLLSEGMKALLLRIIDYTPKLKKYPRPCDEHLGSDIRLTLKGSSYTGVHKQARSCFSH